MYCLARYGMHGFGGGFMGFMMIFWLALIAAVVYFLYKKYNGGISGSSDAMELLRMKFAKGEITEEEYINKKNVLMKK